MPAKIKCSDDRVRAAITAVLLISRERLSRGETENLIAQSLDDYRVDPETYKANKADWPDVRQDGPLVKPRHVAYYRELLLSTDRLLGKFAQRKREFNSLLELDNALIAQLKGWDDGRERGGKR